MSAINLCMACGRPLTVDNEDDEYMVCCSNPSCDSEAAGNGEEGKTLAIALQRLRNAIEDECEERSNEDGR